jgi:hypothetical protein
VATWSGISSVTQKDQAYHASASPLPVLTFVTITAGSFFGSILNTEPMVAASGKVHIHVLYAAPRNNDSHQW